MLDVDAETRATLFRRLLEIVSDHRDRARERPIAPEDVESLVDALAKHDFSAPVDARVVLDAVVKGLRDGQVQVTHPGYLGLFHPAPPDVAVVADALVAAFNPQLATRSHAPWPVAVEDHLVRAIGARFGFAEAAGSFTSGGAEANATALLVALNAAFAEVATRGLRALAADPVLYVSAEGHATVTRAARMAGLGSDAVRVIPADARACMKTRALREAIARDRSEGARPFLVVATVGTTSSGAIDPLPELADVAERAGAWLHVDAAWGGLAAFVPELRAHLSGIERADSIAFDPHKALSVPMGAGMFLTRRADALAATFRERAGYMPRDATRDPYARSTQWSRRFIGLKLFMLLATVGFDGLATSLRRQLAMAARLREGLILRRFRVVNDSALPIVCFVDEGEGGDSARHLDALARSVIDAGVGWLSVTRLSSGARVLRACVDNHRTEEQDIDRVLDVLALRASATKD